MKKPTLKEDSIVEVKQDFMVSPSSHTQSALAHLLKPIANLILKPLLPPSSSSSSSCFDSKIYFNGWRYPPTKWVSSHRLNSSMKVKKDLECRAVVSEGVENKGGDVGVILNRVKDMRGWTKIRTQGGLISLLDQKRCSTPDIGRSKGGLQKGSTDQAHKLIISYDYEALMDDGAESTSSVAVISPPTDPTPLINPGQQGYPVGNNVQLVSAIRGLGFVFGPDFHRVFNPSARVISEEAVDHPPIPPVLHLDHMPFCVGYDGDHYKILGLFERGDLGTNVRVFTIGVDAQNWRTIDTISWHIRTEEWLPNKGILISIGHSTIVYYLGYVWEQELILSFDFRSEQVAYIALPFVPPEALPVLCGLENKLCCAYENFGMLTIRRLMDSIWEPLCEFNLPGIPGLHFCLPIHLHNNVLLVAFRCNFNTNEDPFFANRDHCYLVDLLADTIHLVNCHGHIHWSLAKPFMETLELLPY